MAVTDKFRLCVDDTFDPVSFLFAGIHTGLDQVSARDAASGQR